MSSKPLNDPTLSWQTLPADLLVLILKPLTLRSRTSYSPITSAHVCRTWRQTVIGSPSLWTFVDTARGKALTELWLLNSGSHPIDVRLWQPPEYVHPTHELPLNAQATIKSVNQHIERWRSLDLSFWCGQCITKTIKSLVYFPGILELQTLAIGPMGKALLLPEGLDEPEALDTFQALRIQPTVLRMDSYPINPAAFIFSARLTVIKVFSEPGIGLAPSRVLQWANILRSTPNLISLTLWHQRSCGTMLNEIKKPWADSIVSLPSLKHLILTTGYLEIILLISRSLLPKLDEVRIDVGWAKNIQLYLGQLAIAAPHLSSLALSCPSKPSHSAESWGDVLSKFHSLRCMTLFESDISVGQKILRAVGRLSTLTEMRLERMNYYVEYDWPPAGMVSETPPTLTVVGYDDVIRMRTADGTRRNICLPDQVQQLVDNDSDKTYCSQHSGVYIDYDLAIVHGASANQEDSSDSDDGANRPDEDGSIDSWDKELDCLVGDNLDENSDIDSLFSDTSFTSGDLYVIGQTQKVPNPNVSQ